MGDPNPQKKRWTFTAWVPLGEEDFEPYKVILDEHLKDKDISSWIYQVERSEKGQLHFQGRVSWFKPKRATELSKHLGITVSGKIESNEGEKASERYCSKNFSRVAGPWSSEIEEIFIPLQFKFDKLYPWQEKIVEYAKVVDERRIIHCIINPSGNIGKSAIVGYMDVHRIAKMLPFVNDFKDMMRMCYGVGPHPAYTIDMPKAICKDNLRQLYSGIEMIKGGYCYDDRYTFKSRWMNCPNIFVFTNRMPDMDLLSEDRWALWTVKDLKLIPFVPKADS